MVYLPSGARIMSTNVSNVLVLVSSRIRSRSGAVRGGPGSGDRPEAAVRVPDLRHRQGRLHLKRRTLRGDAAIKWIMIFKITFCLRRAFIFTNINLAIFFLLKMGLFVYFRLFHMTQLMRVRWDSNPEWQNGLRRRIHWAMAAPKPQ